MAEGLRTSLQLPTLTFDNFTYWQYNIRLFAMENGVESYLQQDIAPTDADARKKHAQADRIIISTIPETVQLHLSSEFLIKTPYQKMQEIELLMISKQNAITHDTLQEKARQRQLKPEGNLDEYIESHLKLRKEMIVATYPNIQSDTTTINFIFRA